MGNHVDLAFFNIALSMVAGLFGLLTLVLGWLGSRLYEKLEGMAALMRTIESEVHNRITSLEVRMAHLEAMKEK